MDADKQGERRVESAADTYYNRLCTSMFDAFSQSFALNAENFLATLVERLAFRHEGVRVDGAREREPLGRLRNGLEFHVLRWGLLHDIARGGEGGVHAPLDAQAFHVDFAHHQLLFHREAPALSQCVPVFADVGAAAEHEVLRTFAVAAAGVHVARNEACALLRDEAVEVGSLADELVACAEVEDNVRTLQRQAAAGRHRCP